MIYVCDELPRYCPKCGNPIVFPDHMARSDFFTGASGTCRDCDAQYQYVSRETIVALAGECGDMDMYARK